MLIMHKTKSIVTVYGNVLIVALAFAMMVASSYIFVSNIEHEHLKKDAEIALSQMQARVTSDLLESEIMLNDAAQTIRMMIMRNYGSTHIKGYISSMTENKLKDELFLRNVINIYGAFDISGVKFYAGIDARLPRDHEPDSTAWYKAAVEANGKMAIIDPYYDEELGTVIVTYARSIFDDDGKRLGVICIDVKFDRTIEHIVSAQLVEDGFGFMLNRELKFIAHQSHGYLGRELRGMSIIADDLLSGTDVFEREILSYKKEVVLAFIKPIENGWFVGIVTPKDKYYHNMRRMAAFLSVLGSVLALALSAILIRAIIAKNKADKEMLKKREELEALNHWYKSILDNIPFLVLAQDLNMKITFLNSAAESLFGKKRGDIVGQPCCSLNVSICGTDNCAVACAKRGQMQTHFSRGDSSYQVDVDILKDLSEKPMGYIEIIQDITKIEQSAKAEAESANKAKSAFLAKMSHEIRTPMNAIMGVTEIQMQDESIDPKMKEAFTLIHNSSNLLLGIINNILDLSKIETGKMELSPAKYNIASLVNDTVQLNIMRNRSKRIKFELNINENMPLNLIGDELRIKQILNNLLSNAFKYTEKGNVKMSISFEKEESGLALIFKISDTGNGMTKEQLSKLFTTEYIRFNLEANRMIEGTGLGLNITKHLTQMMNGNISVDSELGKGTTFILRIPQEIADSEILGKEMSENLQHFRVSSSSKAKRMQVLREPMPYGKVLIVDDVESNLYVAKGLMLPYGLSIDLVSSGYEAIDRVKEGNVYDIIFMDHMMPEMDGIETTKTIRSLGYSSPIVALTANALLGQVKIFLENGFDDFISKPIDIRLLNAMLNKLIRDKQTPEVIAKARENEIVKSAHTAREADDELLLIFAKDARKSLPILESTLKNIDSISEEELHLFTINAHAMKSALANIGEKSPAQMAMELEKAGREQNKRFILDNAGKLIEELGRIVAKIESKTKVETRSVDKDEDIVYLRNEMKMIANSCEDYDGRTANSVLKKLLKMSWTKETLEKLDKISQHILHSEFDEAKSEAEKFIV